MGSKLDSSYIYTHDDFHNSQHLALCNKRDEHIFEGDGSNYRLLTLDTFHPTDKENVDE